ncbi:PTS ascorbate transporter subunit IIC [Mesomycoplasma neurolyticum]|uniref:Ascorbate-specific PTS system EIIC component n=1 Tax=Mesomycoplasma neurolyticum TaxID=2120 RepID=A0A449A482_9BACT|nr:PTS ascorbate transporter subunit IIC [Mesomycoplasma neurolyticum]VEU59061.1 Ascorbate-specific PTS system EIIC component [Mesomycoplasma neurolyticum]
MKSFLEKSKKNKILIGWILFLVANLIIFFTSLLVKASQGSWTSEAWVNAFNFTIKTIYLDNFLKQPALVLGFLVFVGYLIIGRGFRESFIGALKTIIGFLLLGIGSGILVGMAKPVFENIKELGGGDIVPLDPYFALANANAYLRGGLVSAIAFTMLVAFAINIVLVLLKKWTNINTLMVTGHIMLQQSAVVTTIFFVLLFRGYDWNLAEVQIPLILISGIFTGVYWAVGSSSTLKITNKVTENAGFAIGHQQMFGIATSYKLGRFFGKKEDTAENRKLPSYLKIFEDNIFTQTVIILLLFLVLFIILIASKPGIINDNFNAFKEIKNGDGKTVFGKGLEAWNGTFKDANIVFLIIGGSLRIVAALIALITGVRMFITELQQSFQGISEKIIPNSVVAVDVAAVYGFSINSVTYGFLSGVIGQFLAVFIVIGLTSIPNQNIITLTIPLFITLFFNSGSLGVYANASGGWKAALLVPGIIGFLEIIIISFALKLVAVQGEAFPHNIVNNKPEFTENPVKDGYIGMADWTLFFGVFMLFAAWNTYLAWVIIVITIVGMLILAQLIDTGMQTKQTYFQKLFRIKPELVVHN